MRATCGQIFNRRFLLEILSPKIPKWVQMGPEPKKHIGFFWLKSKTANTQRRSLDIQEV